MDKLNSRCDIYIQKNELLRCILESIGDAVYFADTQRRIILWNRATEALTGYKASEVIGRACSEILAHQNDQGQSLCETKCPLVSAMRGESFLEEVWMKTAYGVQKAIEINCSAVKSQEGEILGVVEVFRDRTQKKEIEELKENFYSTLTHDLKAPLGSIMGFVQLLKDPAFGEISPQKLEIADNILKSGSLFLSLINNIVDSSRIKNGQLHFSFENINLTKLLNDTKN
ncbi:MAG: PAS domain S-box protein, partial [Vulcanimicrobiota bacterium]